MSIINYKNIINEYKYFSCTIHRNKGFFACYNLYSIEFTFMKCAEETILLIHGLIDNCKP